MLLSGVAKRTSEQWLQLYKASRYQRDFVEGRSGKQPSTGDKTAGDKPKRHFDLTQWFALVKRNTIVKLRDRTQTAILLIQAPLFAALIVLVYHGLDGNPREALMKKLVGIHFLMVVAAIWFGCNNAARDIVGEWTVYKRERMVTLKLGSYVFSKLAVLFGLAVIQCLSLLGIVDLTVHLKGDFLIDFAVLLIATLVGTGLGLCISAVSKTTESAIALLPVVLLPIIALGGGLKPAYDFPRNVRWITNVVPSQWALEANLIQEVGPDSKGDKWPPYGTPWSDSGLKRGAQPTDSQAGQNAQLVCANFAYRATAAYSDVIEGVVPKYDLKCPDGDGKMQESFTSQPVEVTFGESTYKAAGFRHSLMMSLSVLLGMLVLLTCAVLTILMVRDQDVQ
jgi:ABC-type multidrug transport system permease subunit